MQKTKRWIVSLLLMAMILSMLPVSAMATYSVEPDTEATDVPSLQSMMPLKEVRKELDLTGYLPHELEAFPVAKLVEMLGMEKTPAVYAKYSYQDAISGKWVSDTNDFTAFDADGTIDLYAADTSGDDYFRLEVIAGTADQLALDNVRYVVTVKITTPANLFVPTIYTENREKITVIDDKTHSVFYLFNEKDGSQTRYTLVTLNVSGIDPHEDFAYYLGLTLNSAFQGVHVKAVRKIDGTDITSELLDQTDMGVSGGMKASSTDGAQNLVVFTFWRDGDSKSSEITLDIRPIPYERDLYTEGIYYAAQDGHREWALRRAYNTSLADGHFMLNPGLSANGTYYVNLRLYVPGSDKDDNGLSYVKRAVVGYYESESDIPASAPDIKEQLFSDAQGSGGYPAKFDSNGRTCFTVVDTDGKLYHDVILLVPYDIEEDNSLQYTSLNVYGARKTESLAGQPNIYPSYSAYSVSYEDDSYYRNGYQTIFLLEETTDEGTSQQRYVPLAADSIRPEFSTRSNNTVYASTDGGSAVKQVSGQTKIPFTSGKAIPYSVTAADGKTVSNYWVTFLTQQSGPKLFVNAANDESHYAEVDGKKMPQREVYLNSDSNYLHDIFFANVGDAPIEGLYVRLENAENVKLDDYWTVGDTKTLSAFTTTEKRDPDGNYVSRGGLANTAKIRLVPVDDELGVISGTLVIGYTGSGTEPVEEVRINLTGIAGDPTITTSRVVEGVKYVPYSSVIQTNSFHGGMTFTIDSGKLPDGLTLRDSGEIYGVPTKAGTFTFTVKAVYQGNEKAACQRTYTLVIRDNTDENVLAVNDSPQGYKLLNAVDEKLKLSSIPASGVLFRSEGTFTDFVAFYLDGKKLVEGTDYDASEGSTRITIRAQTFRDAGNGTHTIAAEFRADGKADGEMKSTSQNVTIVGSSSNSGSKGNGGNGGGSSSDANVSSSAASDVLNAAAKKIANGDMSYVTEVSSGAVKNALSKGNGIIVSIEQEIITSSRVPADDMALLDAALGSGGSADVYMSIVAVIKDGTTGEILGYLSQLPGSVQFTLDIPQSMLDAMNNGKYIYALRIHDGKAEFLDTTIRNGKASFSSDKFSTYALTVVDHKVQGVKTGDPGVMLYALTAAAATAAGAGVVFFTRRRKKD